MKNILFAIPLLFAIPAAATTYLSPSEALEAALKTQPHCLKAEGVSTDSFVLAKISDNQTAYAFNRTDGTGFAIISAIENTPAPLLGYSLTGRIDPANIPDGLAWFMENVDGMPAASQKQERLSDISPLISTKWAQDAPFNNDCPVQNARNTYVGCMATAIAQVLYHPSNRPQPTGSYSYEWVSMHSELSFDYDANPFDYTAMLDDYQGDYTPGQAAAVANYCYGVGIACNMDYGWMASGCSQYDAADAMRLRLGVDNGIALELRDFYEAGEWSALIHRHLAKGKPVLYIGVSTVGAHAFIADGYQGAEGDYFHINWGWGGMSDGYFLLSALLPEKLGIGGGSGHDGFNSNQMAFLDIKPAEEGSKPAPTMYMTGVFCGEFSQPDGKTVSFNCDHGLSSGPGMFSYALDTFYGSLGLKLVDVKTGEVTYTGESEELEFKRYYGYIGFSMDSSILPRDGRYVVSPVFIRDGIRYDIVHDIETRNELHLICDNGVRKFESIDVSHRVVAENLDLGATEIVRSKPFHIKVDLRAQNVDYSGSVYPVLLNDEGYIAAKMNRQGVDLKDGESVTLEWNEKFTPALSESTYRFTLLNEENLVLLEMMEIPVVKTSVVGSVSDDCSGEDVIYDLNGLKSDGASSGIRIVRSGGKASKVMLR